MLFWHFGLWFVAYLIYVAFSLSSIGGIFIGLGHVIGLFWLWVVFPFGMALTHKKKYARKPPDSSVGGMARSLVKMELKWSHFSPFFLWLNLEILT